MPYCKPKEIPYEKMRKLLLGYEMNGVKMAAILGLKSATTGKRKLDEPVRLTLGDIDRLNRFGHIPIDELREAMVR